VSASKCFAQTWDAEQFLVGVRSLGDSIAEEHERLPSFDFYPEVLVSSSADESNGSRAFCKRFVQPVTSKKKWRGMTGIDVFEIAIATKNAKKHRGVLSHVGMRA
jgi:hypothetical protein